MLARRGSCLLAALAALAWSAGDATAGFTLPFTLLSANGNFGPAVAGQLFVTVDTPAAGQVSFQFENMGPLASTIASIYVDDQGGLLQVSPVSSVLVTNGTGVAFSADNSPGNFPNAPAGFTEDFSASADPPPATNGVDPNEFVTLTFNLQSGTFDDVADALGNGSLRLGLHVISLPDGQSNSYLNGSPSVVPAPPTVILAGLGVLGFGGLARLRRRSAKTA